MGNTILISPMDAPSRVGIMLNPDPDPRDAARLWAVSKCCEATLLRKDVELWICSATWCGKMAREGGPKLFDGVLQVALILSPKTLDTYDKYDRVVQWVSEWTGFPVKSISIEVEW